MVWHTDNQEKEDTNVKFIKSSDKLDNLKSSDSSVRQ